MAQSRLQLSHGHGLLRVLGDHEVDMSTFCARALVGRLELILLSSHEVRGTVKGSAFPDWTFRLGCNRGGVREDC
jgi:hypothetical protein